MEHRERLVVCKTILLKKLFGFFSGIAARSCVSERCFFVRYAAAIGAKAVRAAQLQILISTQGFISGFFCDILCASSKSSVRFASHLSEQKMPYQHS